MIEIDSKLKQMSGTREKQMDQLFDIWKQHIKDNPLDSGRKDYLIRDGIISPKKYDIQKMKVLFVLKETNETGAICRNKSLLTEGGWIYRYLNNEIEDKLLTKITKLYQIIKSPFDIDLKDKNKRILENVAFININKRGHGEKKSKTNLKDVIKFDRELLFKQIELINPDIVIFGCNRLMGFFLDSNRKKFAVINFAKSKNIKFLETWHFSRISYKSFISDVRKYLSSEVK